MDHVNTYILCNFHRKRGSAEKDCRRHLHNSFLDSSTPGEEGKDWSFPSFKPTGLACVSEKAELPALTAAPALKQYSLYTAPLQWRGWKNHGETETTLHPASCRSFFWKREKENKELPQR